MTIKASYLESVDLFRDLSSHEVESIGLQTRLMSYHAGHLFYVPDDRSEALYILKKGRVELYRMSPDGRRVVVAILQPGTIFGQMTLVGQRLHHTYAEALDDCVICVWSRADVERLILEKPRVALRFLESMGRRLIQTEERLEEATFKRIPARVASLLIELNSEQGEAGIIKGYTHQNLADMLGTYRETVTQTLNDFKSDELIHIGRKSIEILNIGGLRTITDA
jgi:CRP-like cAMP-binding protein